MIVVGAGCVSLVRVRPIASWYLLRKIFVEVFEKKKKIIQFLKIDTIGIYLSWV